MNIFTTFKDREISGFPAGSVNIYTAFFSNFMGFKDLPLPVANFAQGQNSLRVEFTTGVNYLIRLPPVVNGINPIPLVELFKSVYHGKKGGFFPAVVNSI